MLSKLYIENIAVIERAEIDFSAGFNVLTGETGAGKSILVDSIMAVLGERTSRELVRTGAGVACVSAQFCDLGAAAQKLLDSLDITLEDGALLLGREIKADGRGVFRINGRPVSGSVLREVGKALINIHGQHENQALLEPARHLGYLDALADDGDLIERYGRLFAAYREAKRELSASRMDEAEKARRMDMLSYQISEIESAQIAVGETQELRQRRKLCMNFERIADCLSEASAYLSGSESASGALSSVQEAAAALDSISDVYADIRPLCPRISSVAYELEDIAAEISDKLGSMDFDPEEINEIEDRLTVLRRIEKKYGGEQEALEYCDNARRELERIELSDEKREQLEKKCGELYQQAVSAAQDLSKSRRRSAEKFCELVCSELSFLDMPRVRFEVDFKEKELSPDGCDDVEFLISVNPGEPPKPISRIASGGELSRIMLAIKNVLADKDDIDTLIFDEIDTGVSGRAAHKIGVKLRETSRSRQVICITHLAQIAANADTHLLIHKEVSGGRTFTEVTPLDFEQRVRELAVINGGENITESMLATAEEMLRSAGNNAKK